MLNIQCNRQKAGIDIHTLQWLYLHVRMSNLNFKWNIGSGIVSRFGGGGGSVSTRELLIFRSFRHAFIKHHFILLYQSYCPQHIYGTCIPWKTFYSHFHFRAWCIHTAVCSVPVSIVSSELFSFLKSSTWVSSPCSKKLLAVVLDGESSLYSRIFVPISK